uniref:Uncharacterized protein n=1 Tax=Arundo donax TaxID=35708 RepID=A0A0A9E4G7_ARUDO
MRCDLRSYYRRQKGYKHFPSFYDANCGYLSLPDSKIETSYYLPIVKLH